MNQKPGKGRLVLSIMTLLVAVWGVLGWFDLSSQTQAGFDTDGNHTVVRVYSGSPAESAGLESGDFITHFDGFSVEDAQAIAHLPRKKAGQGGRYTIERDGETRELNIVYGPLPERSISLARASLIIGFCFLLFPLTVFFRKPGEATHVLAVMGTGLGLAFMTGPHIADYSIRSVTVTVTSLIVLFGVAALLQFLLVFPQRRPWMDRSWGKKLIYLPAFLLWVLIAYRVMLTPAATSSLNTLTNVLSGIIMGGYFLLSLFLILRNYSRTAKSQRKALAINSMLWGTVFGLIPVTIAQLVYAFSPQSVLPGQDYYFISLALIPLTWSRSAGKKL